MINATIERLGILSAESGAGKSSLLAAGYIPELRRRRAAKGGVPPVLLLRVWGGRAATPEERILNGIREGVEDLSKLANTWAEHAKDSSNIARNQEAERIADCMKADHERLTYLLKEFNKGESRGSNLSEVLRALSETEGLILILDQFEEFMGSASAEAGGDQRSAEKVTRAVGRIYRDVPKIRILIALRTEYCRTLQRHLNIFVPNLDRRVIDLSPLPSESIVQIVRGVSKNIPEREIVEFARKLATASGAMEGDGDSSVSVLEVQALLYGYDAWYTEETQNLDFDPSLWDKYVRTLEEEPAFYRFARRTSRDASSEKGIGSIALKHWVDGQLETAVHDSPSSQQARWMLLPVLPRLSTHGGYKQHLPLLQLCLDLADRLSEGWGKIETVYLSVETWLQSGGELPLQIQLEPNDIKTLRQRGVDVATLEPEAIADTQEKIRKGIVEFKATIESLTAKAILKMSGSDKDESCELVHDGLSEHVRRWSEALPKNPATLLGSPVDVVGERFAWRELGGDVSPIVEKVWRGCSVRGATIKNVRFEGCVFRGLSLTDCILENVEFVHCEMQGAIMIGCTMTNSSFEYCKLRSAAFIHCTFTEEVRFKGKLPKLEPGASTELRWMSDLTGVDIIEGCTMEIGSRLLFEQCKLRFAKIERLKIKGGNRVEFVKCDMMNAWVEDQGMPFVGVDQHCRTIGLLSFEPPPDGWLPRGQS